jgi:membrane-associated protein
MHLPPSSSPVVGGIAWVSLFMYAGYFFGGLAFVKNNLSLLIILIVFVSILPGIIEVLRNRKK